MCTDTIVTLFGSRGRRLGRLKMDTNTYCRVTECTSSMRSVRCLNVGVSCGDLCDTTWCKTIALCELQCACKTFCGQFWPLCRNSQTIPYKNTLRNCFSIQVRRSSLLHDTRAVRQGPIQKLIALYSRLHYTCVRPRKHLHSVTVQVFVARNSCPFRNRDIYASVQVFFSILCECF